MGNTPSQSATLEHMLGVDKVATLRGHIETFFKSKEVDDRLDYVEEANAVFSGVCVFV